MPAEAVAQLEKAAALPPESNTMVSLAHAYAISGQKEKALKITGTARWIQIRPYPLQCALQRYSAAHRASSVKLRGRIVAWA
jgi:hypothetical protein